MKLKTGITSMEFNSPYFTIREIAKGIYATQTKPNMYAGANGGFIDLGEQTLLIDTGMIQGATKDLLRACLKFSGRYPFMVVSTHFHTDHVLGNSFIPISIPILGSNHTVNQIQTYTHNNLSKWRIESAKERNEDRKQLQNENDPNKRQKLKSDLAFLDMIDAKDYQLRTPDWILEGTLIIHGKDFNVEICNVGEAHTKEDIIVKIRNQGVLFAGDITFANLSDLNLETAVMPFSTNPQKLINLLQQLQREGFQTIISGHGEIQEAQLLQANIDFIYNNILCNQKKV
ncbi:hypothetical protein [Candidatus Lokiarchaeum ossiferum]|uniref:hypothetical protein n=1 Tax=Candidatus Lokiarchaeum ossiferum TaxID=2951803 RepID=UPI00352F3F6E